VLIKFGPFDLNLSFGIGYILIKLLSIHRKILVHQIHAAQTDGVNQQTLIMDSCANVMRDILEHFVM